MATNKPRYMISVTDEMYRDIEDFRFANRYQTRSEATSELIQMGINILKGMEPATSNHDKDDSKYFGVRKSDNELVDIPSEDVAQIYEGLLQLPEEDIKELNLFMQFLMHKRENKK